MILVLGLGMESCFGWLAVVLDLVPQVMIPMPFSLLFLVLRYRWQSYFFVVVVVSVSCWSTIEWFCYPFSSQPLVEGSGNQGERDIGVSRPLGNAANSWNTVQLVNLVRRVFRLIIALGMVRGAWYWETWSVEKIFIGCRGLWLDPIPSTSK